MKNTIIEEVKKYLTEGLSDILYHYTSINSLINILKTNRFITSSNLGSTSDARHDKGRFFFFSMTRAKARGYGIAKYSRGRDVMFVLNGKKLNQKYKGHPIDYWNRSKNPKDYGNKHSYRDALLSIELEDRIVTNKPYIENAKEYILEIHILIKEYLSKSDIRKIQHYGNDISIYFYDDIQAFRLQNKKKSVQIKNHEFDDNMGYARKHDMDYEKMKIERDISDDFGNIAPYIIVNDDNFNIKVMELLKNTVENHNICKYSHRNIVGSLKYKKENLSFHRGYTHKTIENYKVLTSYINNNRGNPSNHFRELLKLLIQNMKFYNATNLKEYFVNKFDMKID